jgi:hypothetical protein
MKCRHDLSAFADGCGHALHRTRSDIPDGEHARHARLQRPTCAVRLTSVHYWASPLEAKLCAGQEVALVGAGNSAGQAVVYLASQVSKVWLLVRGPSPAAKMSRYLVDRIAGLPNVELLKETSITALEGSSLPAVHATGDRPSQTLRPSKAEPAANIAHPSQRLSNVKGPNLAKPPDPLNLERLKRGEHLLASRLHDRLRRGSHVSLLR